MDKFTIAEYYTLPSQGVIYSQQVVPEVHLSSMTTRHEMQRLAPSRKAPSKPLCDILDDCLIGDVGISSYDMCTGDYQFLLYKLRTVTYGPEIEIEDICPFCGEKSVVPINLDDLPVVSDIETFNKNRKVLLPKTGVEVTLNFQTPHMLDNVVQMAEEYKNRTKQTNVDQSLAFVIQGLIKEVDGREPNPIVFEEWVRDLPMMDANLITAHSNKMEQSLGINTELELECDRCGRTHKTQFKPGVDFFRPRINL